MIIMLCCFCFILGWFVCGIYMNKQLKRDEIAVLKEAKDIYNRRAPEAPLEEYNPTDVLNSELDILIESLIDERGDDEHTA